MTSGGSCPGEVLITVEMLLLRVVPPHGQQEKTAKVSFVANRIEVRPTSESRLGVSVKLPDAEAGLQPSVSF